MACKYAVLGLTKEATSKEIKDAYRSLAKQFHPDRLAATATAAEIDNARRNFTAATEAYSILNHPHRRSTYDRFGSSEATLQSWRNAPNGGTSEPFTFRLFSKRMGPLLLVQGLVSAGVLYSMFNAQESRATGKLNGLHQDVSAHSKHEIDSRLVRTQQRIAASEKKGSATPRPS